MRGDDDTGMRASMRRAGHEVRSSVIWEALRAQRRWLIALTVVSGLYAGDIALVVITIKSVFDDALINHTKALDPLIGNLFGLAFLSFGLGLASRIVGSRLVYHLEYDLRCWLYERLQAVDPAALDGLSAGQLVTRAITDLAFLESFALILPAIVIGGFVVVAIAVVLVVIDPLMGLLAVVGVPINAYVVSKMARRLWGLSWIALNRRAEVTAEIDEAVRGIRVVKAFGAEERAEAAVAQAARGAYGVAMARIRLLARYGLIVKGLPVFFTAAMVWVGAEQAIHHQFTVGALVVYLGFGAFFTGLAAQLDNALSSWEFAKTGSGRIFEMIAELSPPSGATATLPAQPTSGLVAANADIGHDTTPFDVSVPPGATAVVTGPARATTTAASLLAGDWPLAAGTVELDGVPLADLSAEARRQAVVLLSADPFLFGRTVRENLVMGARGKPVTDAQLIDALETAGAGDLLQILPGGLDAQVGDRGMTLSGGQRQRVALARAVVDPPRVLILDDALSAVDPALQTTIVRSLRERLPAVAIVIVSPRALPADVIDVTVDAAGLDHHEITSQGRSFDEPGSDDLAAAVAAVEAEHAAPQVTEEQATFSDARPTAINMLSPLAGPLAAGLVALLLVTLFTVGPDAVVTVVVNAIRKNTTSGVGLAALAIIPIGIALSLATYVLRIQLTRIDEGVLYLLRRRTFRRLTRLGVDFYDRELPGQVAGRVVYDLDRITDFLDNGVFPLITSIVLLIAAGVLIYAVRPKVFFAVGPVLPVVAIFTAIEIPLASRAYVRVRQRLGAVVERFHEDFLGRRSILTFGAGPSSREQFRATSWELRQARRTATNISNVYVSLVEGSTFITTAGLVAVAGHLALKSQMSIGTLVFLEILLTQALAPIPALSSVLQTYLTARASFQTLSEPFEAPILPVERPGATVVPASLAGRLALENVAFSYPGTDRRVLHDVSLAIESGETVAVVGSTGAGKSSVIKLLQRVYDPGAGRVTVDGLDIATLALRPYRMRLGVVPQEPFCFRGTIRSNLLYGKASATDAELLAAIAGAGLEGTLPGGLDGPVDEEGSNLSPTARQCLAIARAWLVRPDILILDEATSCLPEPTERAVLDAVSASGRTTVVVTHRLQVAQWADRVVVVKDGAVVESGTHDALFAKGALYTGLFADTLTAPRP